MTKNYELYDDRSRAAAYTDFNSRAASPGRVAPQGPRPVAFGGLLTNKILTGLPGADFARLLSHLEPVWLACDANLYALGGPADFVYFPENAVVSHLHILSDGGIIEADMIGREGLAGLSAVFNCDSPDRWTKVMIAGSALRVRAEVMREQFALCGGLQHSLLAYAAARLAHGAQRAGITELATSLRARGHISYSRGLIRVTDRRGLEAAACECYALQSRPFARVN